MQEGVCGLLGVVRRDAVDDRVLYGWGVGCAVAGPSRYPYVNEILTSILTDVTVFPSRSPVNYRRSIAHWNYC